MKRSTMISSSVIAAALVAVGVSFTAAGEPPEFSSVKRHSSTVQFFGNDSADQLAKVVIGDGLENIKPAASSMASSGGSIYWKKIRDKDDDKGMRHVFYRQFYRPPIGPVSAASSAATKGAWLVGAEVGLHYDTDGKLVFVFGTQFADVAATSTPILGNAMAAVEATDEALADQRAFSASDLEGRPKEWVEKQLSRAELLLHSTGYGGSFDYVWKLPTGGKLTLSFVAELDAETGELLSLTDGIARSECTPSSTDQGAAVAKPQNSGIANRSVWATETDDRGSSYTHEARKKSSSTNPDIQIFMGMDEETCDDGYYSLMPLQTVGNKPVYKYYTSPDTIFGDVAGDALFFTYKTMATFDDLGRDGWDGNGGDAIVVANAGCGFEYLGGWIPTYYHAEMVYGGEVRYAPTPSLAVCPIGTGGPLYTDAAAIDVIAHEWGHGVIYAENLWAYSGDGEIYHEGWADIIGHIVEWDNQPSGSDYEEADWEFGEDRGTAFRDASYDDGANVGHSLHADDTPGSTDAHLAGNRLATAFFLMAIGGENPACLRDPAPDWDGCDEDVDGIGVDKAGRILFYALTNVATSSSEWDDFGDIAKAAAFFLYADCPTTNAPLDQITARDAFRAIGDSPSSFLVQCGP